MKRYERSAAQHSSQSAFLFFKKMLLYMRTNNCGSIGVSFDMKQNFREFNAFSKIEMQEVADICPKGNEVTTYPKPDTTNVLSIKEFFTAGNVEDIEADILNRIASGLGNVFGEKFFTVYQVEDSNNQTPIISFNYTVRNEQLNDILPEVFPKITTPILIPYHENEKFRCWVLDISADFKESYISIPKDTEVFPLAGKNYTSEKKTYNVTGPEDAYAQLVYSCFVDFQKNVLKELGIKEPVGYRPKSAVPGYIPAWIGYWNDIAN